MKCRCHGFHPWLGKMPWRRAWKSPPVFLLGKPQGQGCIMGCSSEGQKSQTWLSHWAHMHTMAYDWWLHIFGGWKSSSELGMGYYWNFTMEVKMDFLKYSNHPVGMGYPLQVEFWCWRINFEIISKIRNHLDSGYYHRSIKKCHSIQPPSPNPQFNEFVSKIHDCIKHTCIKHQWFPFGVEAYYWGKDSFIHITNYTTPYILPFCKSLYLKFDKVAH